MIWLTAILSALFSAVVKLFQRPAAVVEAEKAGAAEATVNARENENAKVQAASVSGNNVLQSVSSSAGLRKYEASDPDNRDNTGSA